MNSAGEYVGITMVILLLVGMGFLLGFGIGNALNERRMEKEAIEKGYAEYNQQTGDWQWKEKP